MQAQKEATCDKIISLLIIALMIGTLVGCIFLGRYLGQANDLVTGMPRALLLGAGVGVLIGEIIGFWTLHIDDEPMPFTLPEAFGGRIARYTSQVREASENLKKDLDEVETFFRFNSQITPDDKRLEDIPERAQIQAAINYFGKSAFCKGPFELKPTN